MSICCQNLMMSCGKCCLRLLMVVLSVLLHMVNVRHYRWRMSVVWAFIHRFCLNLNWLLLRLNNCQRGSAIAIWMVMVMIQMRIIHRIQVAHLDVLVEVTNVGQLLLANVALINDIVGSWGRWQNCDRTILSVLSVFLLMCQNVLLQIRLLRIWL